jgi:PAS domain S-box-containing protein
VIIAESKSKRGTRFAIKARFRTLRLEENALIEPSNNINQSPLMKFWELLTKPDKTIVNPDERRQAQFLAALLLTLTPLGLVLILLPRLAAHNSAFFRQPFFFIVAIATGLAIVTYTLSRSSHYKKAAAITVIAISAVAFAIPLTGNQTFHYEIVIYLTVSVLLSSILLSLKATTLLAGAQILGCILLPSLSAGFTWDDMEWVRLGFLIIVSVAILLITYYRNSLEHDRQLELNQIQSELEMRVAERTAALQQMSIDLQREIADHQFAERIINETYAELEQRIAERTAELSETNKQLQEHIAERIRAEAAEREQRILAEGLKDTAAAINSVLELDEILDRILVYIERILPYDSASVMLVDNGVARVVHGRGFDSDSIAVEEALALRLPLEQHGNLLQMYETQRPVIIVDTNTDPQWHFLSETHWIRSYVAAPIRIEGKVIGFVNLDSKSPHTFNESHAEKLLAFADQAGIALRNAELFETLRQYTADLEVRVSERTAEVKREQAQLQAIMDSMNEGLFGYIQNEKESTYINAALLQMTGYSTEEWNFQRLKPTGLSEVEFEERLQAMQSAVSSNGIWQGECQLQRKDGSEFSAYLTTSRIDNQDGQPIGSVTIVRDISQEKELQEVKSRFVANASHELRTPLTNLITRLYLLRKQPEQLEEHLVILDRVAARMRSLVEDLLDYSRFERGVIPLKSRSVDLRDLINDVIQMQCAEADAKGIGLDSELPENPIIVSVDPERINQAITNLVVNALFYTPEGGRVRVQLTVEESKADKHGVIIRVQDNGPGIPDTLLPNIFLPFHRGSENNKGTGLGLAIAKEVIDRHGGQISVESLTGQGGNFVIRLPFLPEGH